MSHPLATGEEAKKEKMKKGKEVKLKPFKRDNKTKVTLSKIIYD